jgi:phage/plasmid-associated DNA primase
MLAAFPPVEAERGVRQPVAVGQFSNWDVLRAELGRRIIAHFLFANSFEFQPEFKIWLGVNHNPAVRGTDEGIRRRLRLIPFAVTIPVIDRKPLKEMLDAMRAEWPRILNWAMEGLKSK